MIDYLKILIRDKELAKELFKNPLLNKYSTHQSFKKFKNNIVKEVEEIKQATHTKEYKEILFCFFSKKDEFTKLEIFIKPHYYFNNNLHNANDFTAADCINVLEEIKSVFNLPINKLIVLNIEFGINGVSPIDIKDLISQTIYHEKNEFNNSSDNLRFSKISFKYSRKGNSNNYKKIKFYAKGIQFPQYCDPNTFRLEIKSKRSKYINKLNIYSYEDLLKPKTYQTFGEELLNEWRNVLILDIDNKMQNLNSKEVNKLKDHLNTLSWYQAIEGSKNTFNNHKKKYFKLLDKTGSNIHLIIEDILKNKLNYLLKSCAISTPPKELKNCAILNTNIIENGTSKLKSICPVTGLPLIHEKEGSKYIKISTLRYLHDNDEKKYIELCSLLLNNYNGNRPKYENNIISHLAKQVRNRYYSQTKNKHTGYNQKIYPNQLKLFNLIKTI